MQVDTQGNFIFKHLTRAILEAAADNILKQSPLYPSTFMCHAIDYVMLDDFSDTRMEFRDFLAYNNLRSDGTLEYGFYDDHTAQERDEIRAMFLLNCAEFIDAQKAENIQKQKVKPKFVLKNPYMDAPFTDKEMREYITALRKYAYKPKEFFADKGTSGINITNLMLEQSKRIGGICAAIKYYNGNSLSYNVWVALHDCQDAELRKIYDDWESIAEKKGGRTPERIKMSKALYAALRRLYPV